MPDRIFLCDGDDCTLDADGGIHAFAQGFLRSRLGEVREQHKSYEVDFATQRDARALEMKIQQDFKSADMHPQHRFQHIHNKAKLKKELMDRYGMTRPIASMRALDAKVPPVRVLTGEGVDQGQYTTEAASQAAYQRMLEPAVDRFIEKIWTEDKLKYDRSHREGVHDDQRYWENLGTINLGQPEVGGTPTYMTKVYHMLNGMLRADDGVTALDDSEGNCKEMQGVLDLLETADQLSPTEMSDRFEALIQKEEDEGVKAILRGQFTQLRAKEAERKRAGKPTIASQSIVYKFEHGACYDIKTFEDLDKRHSSVLYDIAKMKKTRLGKTLVTVAAIADEKDVRTIVGGVSPQVCRHWVTQGDLSAISQLVGKLDAKSVDAFVGKLDPESRQAVVEKCSGSPVEQAKVAIAAEKCRLQDKRSTVRGKWRRGLKLVTQKGADKPLITGGGIRDESRRATINALRQSSDPKNALLQAAGNFLDEISAPDAWNDDRSLEEQQKYIGAMDKLAQRHASDTFMTNWKLIKNGVEAQLQANEAKRQAHVKQLQQRPTQRPAKPQVVQVPGGAVGEDLQKAGLGPRRDDQENEAPPNG